jgi:hypothetical protein
LSGFGNSLLIQELHLELSPLGYGLIVEAIEHYRRRGSQVHQFEMAANNPFEPLDYQEVFRDLQARNWTEEGGCQAVTSGNPVLKLTLAPGPKLRKISRSDLLCLVGLV